MSGRISEGEGDEAAMVTKLQNEFDASQEEVRNLRAKLNEQAQIKEMNTLLTGTDEEVRPTSTFRLCMSVPPDVGDSLVSPLPLTQGGMEPIR